MYYKQTVREKDLVPGGKSTVRYVELKLQTLEEIKGTLFHMLDNVNTVLLALRRRYNQILSLKLKK